MALSNMPKIVFVGFDDKPIDLAQTIAKPQKTEAEQKLTDYFTALYAVGESTK